jgi:DNA polymerase-3 subunit delta
MIYLLLNADEYLVTQRIAQLKQAAGDADLADLNTVEVAEQTAPGDLLGQAGMVPFLAARRLIIAPGYLTQLDKRMAASQGKDSAAHQEAAQLLMGLSDVPDTSDIIFWETSSVDKRRGLWKGFTLPGKDDVEPSTAPGLQQLIKRGVITAEENTTPDPKALPGWIQRQAQSNAIKIEPRAAHMLADFVGPNLRQLDNELTKLAAYATGRAITAQDVTLLVSDASEALIWGLTDALSQRNERQAIRSLYELRRGDANAFYLLTMIARQYRIIIKVKEGMQRLNTPDEIARYVKESPYPVKKAMPPARSYSFQELHAIMDRLLRADMAMKSGADPETTLDILVAELTQRR